jgi:hypothetical protein
VNDLPEQYSKMVECATELADYFLDQEGGAFALAVACEMLQVLLRAGELPAANLVVDTICQMSEIDLPRGTDKQLDKGSFDIKCFVELLIEVLKSRFEP